MIDNIVYWLSRSGDGFIYGIASILLLFSKDPLSFKLFLAGLIAFSLEIFIQKVTKHWVKRGRPFDRLPGVSSLIRPPDRYSFPSGHTAGAFLFANIAGEFLPFLQIPLWSWAGLVGFSRIYLGVHYPLDVLAGIVLGFISAELGMWLIF
ncbi:phosphatase PAP2 family protein [candidate division KSB1 bacterium]|nr:phosphatase PAP2 family protein [candidate division KSB1 bacterium]